MKIMSNGYPKYIKDCPVLLPDETHRFFAKMRGAFDGARSGVNFEAGSSTHPGFKSGYFGSTGHMFNGHNQSSTISTSNKYKK